MIDKRELRLSIMTTMTIVRSNQPAIEQNNPLKIIDFTFGGIDLTLKGEEALRKIAQALKANPNNTIKFIPGYGPRGGKAQNERLALKRAKQVEGMLKNMGVSENQIVVLRKAQQFSVAAVGYTIKEPKAIPNTAISKNPSVVLNNNPSQTTGLQTTGSVFGLNYANKDIGYYGRAAWEVFANSWGEIPGELKKLLNPTTIMVLAAVGVATVVAPQVMLPALTAAGVGMNAIGALRIIGRVITAENDRDIRDAAKDFAAFITLPAVTIGLGKIASASGLNQIIPVLNSQKVIKSLPGPIQEFLTFMSSNRNNLGKMKDWISKNINIPNLPKGWNFPNFGSGKKTTVATAGNTNITPPLDQGQKAPAGVKVPKIQAVIKSLNIQKWPKPKWLKGWNFPNFGSGKKATVPTAGNTNITPSNNPDLRPPKILINQKLRSTATRPNQKLRRPASLDPKALSEAKTLLSRRADGEVLPKALSYGLKLPPDLKINPELTRSYVAQKDGTVGWLIVDDPGLFEKINTNLLLQKAKMNPKDYGNQIYGIQALPNGKFAIGLNHIPGKRLADVNLSTDQYKNIGQQLAENLYREWKVHGNYNTDLHPGNILIQSDNVAVTIDPQLFPERAVDLSHLRPNQITQRDNLQEIYKNQGLPGFVKEMAELHPQIKLIKNLMERWIN